MERYVVMGLSGGLGNQLFQYASGLGIATRLDAVVRLEDSRVRPDELWFPDVLGPHYRRASRLDLVRLGEVGGGERAIDKARREAARLTVRGVRRLARRTPAALGQDVHDVGCFDPSLLTIDLPVLLRGWYQTEQYFEDVADEVVAHLHLPDVPVPAHLDGDRPLVAISFRRGDYVRQGWQLPLSYFERALARLAQEVPDAGFLVFGDDREFVRLITEWVARYGPATDAYDVAGGEIEHLVLASACDHAVIANSSFAWWGAWLGERRPGRTPGTVLAPAAYPARFGNGVVPDRWELVSDE